MGTTVNERSLKKAIGHVVRQVIGWTALIVGVVGVFFPFIQGALFIAIGALLLAPYVRIFRRLSAWFYQRYPNLRKHMKHFRVYKKEPPKKSS